MKLNLENIKAFLIKNKNYVIIAVVFLVMVFTLVKVSSSNSSEEATQAESEEVITVDETTQAATEATTEVTNDLQVNAYPAVNELITKFYTAMASGDVDSLLQIVNPLSEEQKTQIQQKKEYIEGYNNITCYTKVGPEENSYIVFVYYEIKFININTLVPGEMPYYVCTNEDGSLYINLGELSPETDSYIAGITAGQDVVDLIKSVDTKFAEAQAADPDLKAFIDKLSGTTQEGAATTEEAAATETPVEEAPAEEVPAADAATEEQPAEAATDEGIQEVDETIYATETVNVRDTNSEDGSRLGQLYVGESAKRTAIYADGWSRIEYSGQTGYVLSEFLTTEGATQETKYLSETVNIRQEADENSDRVGTAYEGAKVTRVAELDNGWSKINSDGVTGYVKSEFLSDTYK